MSSSELTHLVVKLRAGATPHVKRARRALLVRRLTFAAMSVGAELDLHIDLDVELGRGIRIFVEPGTRNRLFIGPGCELEDGTRILLKGGDLELEGWDSFRPGCTFNISGRLRIGTAVSVGTGSLFHVAHDVTIGKRCAFAEYVTVVDTTHIPTDPDVAMALGTSSGSVHIGEGCFIAAKVTIPRNAKVGDHCVIGASSVVVGEVPARTFYSGVPARYIKDVTLPWE